MYPTNTAVPEGPVSLYQLHCANKPAGLIQDQPRGLFTDCLIIEK